MDEPRRGGVRSLHDLIRRTVPDLEPHIRSGMIGYGEYHYRYESGREGDTFVVGLASNKRYISVYLPAGSDIDAERLPQADVGRACIRLKRLDGVDLDALADVVRRGAEGVRGSP